MLKILLLLSLLTPLAVFSKIEINQKVEVLARSFPVGGFSKFTLEAINPLWGKRDHPKDITYGFFGAKAEYRTSAVVNYLSTQAFIYPLPILGIFIGGEKGIKQIDKIDTFDCDINLCRGKMERQFTGFRIALGYKDLFFMSENKWSNIKSDKSDKYFVDEMTTLLGSPNKDSSFISLNILGIKLNDQKKSGLIFLHNKMKKNTSSTSMLNAFYEQSWGQHSLISSLGAFKTRQDSNVATLLFLYSFKTPSSLRLF